MIKIDYNKVQMYKEHAYVTKAAVAVLKQYNTRRRKNRY